MLRWSLWINVHPYFGEERRENGPYCGIGNEWPRTSVWKHDCLISSPYGHDYWFSCLLSWAEERERDREMGWEKRDGGKRSFFSLFSFLFLFLFPILIERLTDFLGVDDLKKFSFSFWQFLLFFTGSFPRYRSSLFFVPRQGHTNL